ncbi:hypothetical protein fugu_013317 [Takifugu bimaculatus]|uniref:MARVEL domain-containing protein n=1 Tax=Takifugu bimaculatus TaxID=433685 RepID=A0A4Z2C2W5_9TELE|nr:hypothetical protein fugu_013317 [Takifugu bimaculatus]
MEGSKVTAGEDTAGKNQVDRTVLLSSKPLHRFVKMEPKTLGIVIVIFGWAELLMGCQLSTDHVMTSFTIYAPLWQGLLFLICGSLSIYTEVYPSKKLVTVCLSMYIVSVLGIIVSFIFRIIHLLFQGWGRGMRGLSRDRSNLLVWIDSILLISSACVLVVLIFLCAVARLALKSTRNQVIVHQVRPSQITITSY